MKTKKCSKCRTEKSCDCFCKNKNKKDGIHDWCVECVAKYKKSYREKSKEKIKNYNREYIRKRRKDIDFREKENENWKTYYKNNKKSIIAQKNVRFKERLKEDIEFKLKHHHRTTINHFLREDTCKTSSIWNYLPYTPQQLKEHLEKQFEDWMNWDNWGLPDNDRKTWQIDHIIPTSKLKYSSVEDNNFKICWSLNNLRPLDARENIRKSNKIPYEYEQKNQDNDNK